MNNEKDTFNPVAIFHSIVPVILAAFSYPLGNRKMMEVCGDRFNTFQRVFGMTLCSMPFWVIISISGVLSVGLPSKEQIFQSLIVAVFSGIIATILFFKATDIVSSDTHKLAVIESTQSGEVIFTVIGGVFIFHDKIPTFISLIGILLVVIGMILNSIIES
ncbi:Putative multidrug resistance efflux transporter [Clostridium uliginosum]|uniref:Putative multidrug resistance efflux transporter n=1 Tax=Clostridium uliginosum TaxID=119641 RepID=A0A1I1P5I3_9CLOT|nr:Putative multidrug resistance efflux transporter [Clostridium uliginosum]